MKSEHGKLIVKNFGPIKHAEIDLKQVMILIGPQGTGKSTLLKIINGLERYARIIRKSSHTSVSDFTHLAFSDLGIADMVTANTQIEFTTSTSQIELRNKSDVHLKISEQGLLNLQELVFIPAERIFFTIFNQSIYYFINKEIKIPETLRKFGIEWTLAKEKVLQLPIGFLNVHYTQVSGSDLILFGSERQNSVALENSASGFQSSIPMAIILENISKSSPPSVPDSSSSAGYIFHRNEHQMIYTLFIEEPELNLFPDAQKKLVEYMANRLINNHQKPHSLYTATHSPYILTSFNNLLFAHQVAKKTSEAEVEKIIPKQCWINPDNFGAYYVADGTARSIIDPKTKLISENELDNASEIIMDDFYKLMDIYKSIPA